MNSSTTEGSVLYRRAALAALLGGLAAGFLDEMSAFAALIPHGSSVQSITQFQASGLIGTRAFSGGVATSALGLAVHFGLTIMMAAVFVLASNRSPRLRRHIWVSGIVYGILIFVAMNYLIVPASGVPRWKAPSGWGLIGALWASCFYVGVPIAAVARAFLPIPTPSRERSRDSLDYRLDGLAPAGERAQSTQT